ncbi:dipeptidyl aminopeptidase/acylaminoacyl peptidase [Altererythrobacter atlanticus]|uniref:Prolyl tripeptidyl peptidase n=1 Tax=Croceibacterium atlanticum TaxID=1267766 RepID=A0A0F7KUL7_9SPHN|nr:S9 family peptidase [Croceibacterium atlanticum]AKH44043.1 Prolyl tripeptidyl peptidase precursor [Croceibacterium atlanticum]MBB5732350.1 dipeptidyl aminopeptidase/acylaminoacyl peptidase [Croceibacterium atlanticum]
MAALGKALIILALAAPTPLLARTMTPEDVVRLQAVGAIEISRDGSHIAYTRSHRPDVTKGEKDGGSRQQLYLASGPDNARAWLPEDMSVSGVGFSPDSSMVSFLWKKDDEKRAVWGIPVDGGAWRKLAEVGDADIRSYAWAPDGSTIYLLAGAAPDETRDKEKKAGFDSIVYEEEFRFNRLFAARIGAEVDADPAEITVPGHVSAMKVSPDGNWAMIETAPTPLVDDSYTSKRVAILDLASGEVLRTVETPGKIGDVEISPDGSKLSMIAAVDRNDPAPTTLYFVDVATGEYRALNEGEPEAAVDTEWMADGRLAAVIHVGAQSVLRFYNDSGNMIENVDPGDLILSSLEQGGNRLIVRADAPTHPGELFLYAGYGEFDRWTNSNPWLADIEFGTQRTMIYTARDGQAVEGILIEPVGTPPLEGSPTIMMVHGGPEAHYSNGWLTAYSMPGQVAAGQGYAVFHPNYRGSTAYGTAFSKQHQGNYTDPEFTDIVDGKNALVDMLITDPARVGITGGSYGGYATGWSATALTEEYAAGVMFVGISDQISKFGKTDIPEEMYLVHSTKWPWEDWMGMLEVSPIYHAGKADTPLLIMHGTDDPRVPPDQSYELYRFIKLQTDTPVRLVLYPGEGHGNSGTAARYDYNVRMMRWFDTYLKTGNRDAEMPPPRPALESGGED